MKTAYHLTMLVLTVVLVPASFAQITFDSNYFTSRAGEVVDEAYYERSSFDVTPLDPAEMDIITDIIDNRTGPGQTFDFSGVTYSALGTLEFSFLTSTSGLPGADDPAFATANLVSSAVIPGLGETYVYYVLSSAGLDKLGSYGETIFGSQLITFSPPVLEIELPLADGSSWTTVENSSLGFSVDLSATVEGYGTLILPGGTQAQALRVKRTRTHEIAPGFADIETTYEFLTLEGHIATVIYEQPVLEQERLSSISYTKANSVATANESAGELPEHAVLLQNYPNPFNPSTLIPFDLSNAGDVSLRIYDTLGREVASAYEGSLPAGRHEVAWTPADDIPSGAYYYRLQGDGLSVTRSLHLLR